MTTRQFLIQMIILATLFTITIYRNQYQAQTLKEVLEPVFKNQEACSIAVLDMDKRIKNIFRLVTYAQKIPYSYEVFLNEPDILNTEEVDINERTGTVEALLIKEKK